MENNDTTERPACLPEADLGSESSADFVRREDRVALRAAREPGRAGPVFPIREAIAPAEELEVFETGSEAVLYSFSIVHVSATRPVPYAVGYIDFADGLRAFAEIRCDDFSACRCDLPVRLVADEERWWVEPKEESA